MATIVQEPYNMFAQQKMAGYPNAAQILQQQQKRTPGQVQGETVDQFVQGKQAANSQTGAVSQPTVVLPSSREVEQKNIAAPSTYTPQKAIDPNSSTAGMDYLNSLYTSPEEEERLRKASVANQRILAVGDALRHIGNIFHTVNYAPSQQFNQPWAEEQARYERGKSLRDKANLTYYSYQQQKAAQDAKIAQAERQFQLSAANAASQHAYRQEQARIAAERAANQKAYYEGNIELGRGKLDETIRNNKERSAEAKRYNNARISQGNQRISIAKQNLELRKNGGGSGGGSSIPPLDTPKGQIVPSGRNYNNQIQQMWDYAESKGLVKKSDVQRALQEAGFGKETPENVKRQQVMSLLRNNQALADYAVNRLGWKYGNDSGSTSSTNWDEFAEDEEDWNDYLED